MKLSAFFILSIILSIPKNSNAQQWLEPTTEAQEQLFFALEKNIEYQANPLSLAIFKEDSNWIGLQYHSFNLGMSVQLEQELDPGFAVKDLFVYDFGISYALNRFDFTFVLENFLNLNQLEAGIVPNPLIIDNVVQQLSFELDSPFLISLGVTFTF